MFHRALNALVNIVIIKENKFLGFLKLDCYCTRFWVYYWNKLRIMGAASIRGRSLLILLLSSAAFIQGQRLIEGRVCLRAAFNQINTVWQQWQRWLVLNDEPWWVVIATHIFTWKLNTVVPSSRTSNFIKVRHMYSVHNYVKRVCT